MMFFEILKAMIDGCLAIMSMPIMIGGFTLSLWVILFGSAVISLVALLIWGLFA